MLTTIVAFLIVIGVLVFVHELGHLIVAKSVGIDCPRFSIGFGPRIAGFNWGGTEYVISLLPLGGYVRMAGMEDMEALEGGKSEEPHEPSPGDFDAKPLWARICVVTAGVAMNFLFAIVVVAGVSFFHGEPVNPSTRVAVVSEPAITGPDAALATIPDGAEITAVGTEPVSTWNDVLDALDAAPAGALTLEFADAAPVTLELPSQGSERAEFLQPLQPFMAAVVGEVIPGSPAARAGLQPGDTILEADGAPVRGWSQFVEVVRSHPGIPLALSLERDGAPRTVTVTPEEQTEKDSQGQPVEIGKLGVGAGQQDLVYVPLGIGASINEGAAMTWNTSSAIVLLLRDLLTGAASPRSLGGPLTIGAISGQAVRMGFATMLHWMALLSVNLAVLNLLPIPVLDGGQLLFLIVEGVRGRPLSVEQRLRLSNLGVILVVGIMVWALTNDVLRLFGV